ncbi:hypothetical protein LUZ60_004142 [Juncus effusus]|nr:hypothetical protein LUZ60_004142 [Juncus effusus]
MTTNLTKNKPSPSSGMSWRLKFITFIVLIALLYQKNQPPPPKVCGSPNGPPVTSTRIKLKDGRYIAYKEWGIPKENAKYKIVFLHGFGTCRFDIPSFSQEVFEELGVYLVSYDRPGYGESDLDPKRSVKKIATDLEELADNLNLGSKFHVIGYSLGGASTWSVVKHIPHRLLGVTFLAPVSNYWWSGFPSNVTDQAWNRQLTRDKWSVWIAHHAPWLVYWWNTQTVFPASSVIAKDIRLFCPDDLKLLPGFASRASYIAQVDQQGVYESLHRDMKVGFSKWDFSPLDLPNPFPNNEGSVHIWHGAEDRIFAVHMSRYIAQKLNWIQYHELPTAGHMFPFEDGMADHILKTFLKGD